MYGAHAAACTPTTRASGSAAATARPMPPARPPPPSGTTTTRRGGRLPRDLEPHRRLAGHHLRLVERVDHAHPALVGEPRRLGLRLVVAAVHEGHLAAVLAHRRHLGQRRPLGHHEQRAAARRARRERHRLRVVARAGGHHAGGQLGVRQLPDRVRGSARLERAGHLKVLRLERARARPRGATARRRAARASPSPCRRWPRRPREAAAPRCGRALQPSHPGHHLRICAHGHGRGDRPPAREHRGLRRPRAARARGGGEGGRAAQLGPRRDPVPRGRRRATRATSCATAPCCSRASTRTAAWWPSPSSGRATCSASWPCSAARPARPRPRRSRTRRAVALLAGDVQRLVAAQPRPRAQAARRARRAREHHHRAAAEAVLPDGGRSRGEHAARPDAWCARPRVPPTATC